MVYIIFISIIAPLIMLLFLIDKQARTTILFMIIGMISAVISYEINSVAKHMISINEAEFQVTISPIIEEVIKSIPPLFFALLISDKRRNIIGISMAVGIGFAILENLYLLVGNYRYVSLGWAFVRGFSTGLMHGITTAVIGYGMIFINKKKKLFYTGIFGLLCLSIIYHSMYNIFIQSQYYYIGFIMPILTYILISISIKRNNIPNKL